MMAAKRFITLLLIVSFIGAFALFETLPGASLAWASGHDKKPAKPVAQGQRMERKPPAAPRAAAAAQPMPMQPPTTLEGYLSYVQNKVKFEAAKIKQSGTAELKLTIAKDGSVKQTEIVKVEGPATLRDQIMPMVNQMGKLPPLPADADVLVVTSVVAFNYPGGELLDRFGQSRRGRRS